MLGKKEDTPNKETTQPNKPQTTAKDYKAAKEGTMPSGIYSNPVDFDDDVSF